MQKIRIFLNVFDTYCWIMVVSDPDRFGPYKLVVSDPKYLGSETTNLVRTLLGSFGRYVSDPSTNDMKTILSKII